MSAQRERRQADGMMRLLLGNADPVETVRSAGWAGLALLARRHGVLLRVADRLTSAGEMGPPSFREAVQQEQQRVSLSLNVVRRVSAACEEHGVDFLFPKVFQHLPDLGGDLDLLIVSDACAVDELLLQSAGVRARRRGTNRMTRATAYEIDGCPSLLDVQHGRLGRMGEHDAFPAMMLASARQVIAAGAKVRVPSPEHQLILQGMQRVFGRAELRLSDLVYTIASLRRDELDWRSVLDDARSLGVFEALACYLSYVEQIHRDVLYEELLPYEAAAIASSRRWGRLEFRAGSYRFPAVRVNRTLYFAKLTADVLTHRWSSAGRVALAPAVAAAGLMRRAVRAGARYVAATDAFGSPAADRPRSLS